MRFLPIAVAGLVAAGALASSASADSIVYAKDGNLFLTSADGSKGYQVTRDGGYSSPSQAADGTIGAVRGGQLVRLDRRGRLLGAPVDAIGGPGSLPGIAGPYDARLSADGRRFAYWFYVQTATNIPYPSWSSDSQLLAYGASDGVRVLTVPDSLDCSAMTERTVAPGATEPAFGPADVDAPAAAVAVRRMTLRPRVLHRGGRATLRFRLSAPARVKVRVDRRTRVVSGRRGANRVVLRARGVSLGRHRLSVRVAGGRARTIAFRVVR